VARQPSGNLARWTNDREIGVPSRSDGRRRSRSNRGPLLLFAPLLNPPSFRDRLRLGRYKACRYVRRCMVRAMYLSASAVGRALYKGALQQVFDLYLYFLPLYGTRKWSRFMAPVSGACVMGVRSVRTTENHGQVLPCSVDNRKVSLRMSTVSCYLFLQKVLT